MTLDELLLEWSYRSEKGYPSLDNPSDVSVLKTLLEQLDLPANVIIKRVISETNLQSKDFKNSSTNKDTKYRGGDRAHLFIDKINNKSLNSKGTDKNTTTSKFKKDIYSVFNEPRYKDMTLLELGSHHGNST